MRRWPTWILAMTVAVFLLAQPAATEAKYRKSNQVRTGQRVALRSFHAKPAMAVIPETRVYYVRDEADFDLYQYGSRWYLVENGTWYRAPSWRGPFLSIRKSLVPRQVVTVPAGYRRNWVATSTSRRGRASIAVGEPYPGSLPYYGEEPRMAIIPDTRVYYLRDESDYDLYRLGNSWFMVRSDSWYRASSWRGPFRPIRMSAVPQEIRTIPAGFRRNWVAPGTPVPRNPDSY